MARPAGRPMAARDPNALLGTALGAKAQVGITFSQRRRTGIEPAHRISPAHRF